MKKLLTTFFALAVFLFGVQPVMAAVTPVTPSTNDINRTNGWAHVNQTVTAIGSTTLEFVSTRTFASCFEYRTDGDTHQVLTQNGGINYNTDITNGLYPYVCVNNSMTTRTITANQYVEVRMVFGAETDERFDWIRLEVLPAPFVRSAVITSPLAGESVSGTVSFDATLTDKDEDDSVQWAVRKGTCAAGTGTVLGNVDGKSDSSTWNGTDFHASANTAAWEDGQYCFVFNPTESAGDTAIRETREFIVETVIGPPADKNECKKDGWKTFNNPTFKNQGDCVSYVQSNDHAGKRN